MTRAKESVFFLVAVFLFFVLLSAMRYLPLILESILSTVLFSGNHLAW